MIKEEVVQEVLNRTDILDVIGEYVRLKKAGNSYKGLCPFHGEKTPSFHVTPEKGLYYCFGCSAGGTVVDFLKGIEGFRFPEAIEYLANRLGIEIVHDEREASQRDESRRRKERLERVQESALSFFRAQLKGERGELARRYVARRGLSAEIVESFGLGYAPDSWDALLEGLKQSGYRGEHLAEAGLVVPKKKGQGHYDRFRNRLIFPVFDAMGRCVAFGGRALEESEGAKYINSPETQLYKKGRELYGLHLAKKAARQGGRIILVEGNIDVLKMHQAGFTETVAPMGTALTLEQARTAARYSGEVVLLFDGDAAGEKASGRAFETLVQTDLTPRVAFLPKGEDPDSFLETYGPGELSEILESSLPLAKWILDQRCEVILAAPVEGRGSELKHLKAFLDLFPSELVRTHYLGEAARRLGRKVEELGHSFWGKRRGESAPRVVRVVQREELDPMEKTITGLLLQDRERLLDFVQEDGLKLFDDPRLRALLEGLSEEVERGEEVEAAIALMPEEEERTFLLGLLFESTVGPEQGDDAFAGAQACLLERWVRRESQEIATQLEIAIKNKDIDAETSLKERYAALISWREQAKSFRRIHWDTLTKQ